MPNTRTKTTLSETDISGLKKEVYKLTSYMCTITDHISTPKTKRGCIMSKDLEDIVDNLTTKKANETVIRDIRESLEDISDIAVGVEVGIEDILIPTRKTKKHFHNAKKLVTNPVPA